MQTIALICTDDTGEGVLEGGPEEPDERYDDMTLIGKATCTSLALKHSSDRLCIPRSVPALGRGELDGAVPAARRKETAEVAHVPWRRSRSQQARVAQV